MLAIYQPIGAAIAVAIITRYKKPFEISIIMFEMVAPSTFLIPISFVRCTTANAVTANKPRQANIIASPENVVNTPAVRCSVRYRAS